MPPRFRQRLLLQGQTFEDTANLDSAMDLELVLMPFADVSEAQVNDLAAAAEQGFVNEVESMLRLPQDPNSHDCSGFTALMRACDSGAVEAVRLLLEAAADTELADRTSGWTALIMASQRGRIEVVRLLLDAGAEKDAADRSSLTALMKASANGHVEVVRLLLAAGANKDLAENRARTALMVASECGSVDVVRLLLQAGAAKELAGVGGYTALLTAAEKGHVEIVRLLLDAGADKDCKLPRLGSTPLMLASRDNHVEVVRLLLEAGAKMDLPDSFGRTAVSFAKHSGNTAIVQLLSCATIAKERFQECFSPWDRREEPSSARHGEDAWQRRHHDCNMLSDVCFVIAALIRRKCKWNKEEFSKKLQSAIKLLSEAVCVFLS
ncbi:Ankrd17 [Symbiodinium microadriaticum]|nr:Ankrd17 [Symbiodinium microadriaticum]